MKLWKAYLKCIKTLKKSDKNQTPLKNPITPLKPRKNPLGWGFSEKKTLFLASLVSYYLPKINKNDDKIKYLHRIFLSLVQSYFLNINWKNNFKLKVNFRVFFLLFWDNLGIKMYDVFLLYFWLTLELWFIPNLTKCFSITIS